MGVLVYYHFPFILYQALYHCAGYAGHAGVKTLASCSGARIHGVYAHTPFFIHEIGVHGLHTLHRVFLGVTVGAIKNPPLGAGWNRGNSMATGYPRARLSVKATT